MDTKTAWNCYDITDIHVNCKDVFPYMESNCKELLDKYNLFLEMKTTEFNKIIVIIVPQIVSSI